MKKLLCIITAFAMIFSFAACGKKIVVNKKPHVETSDINYDETEVTVMEEGYLYCGMEYELADVVDILSFNYSDGLVYNIVCDEEYQSYADNLTSSLDEFDIKYTINGEAPDEEVLEDESSDIITE